MNIPSILQRAILSGDVSTLDDLSDFGEHIAALQPMIRESADAIAQSRSVSLTLPKREGLSIAQPEQLNGYAVEENLALCAQKFEVVDVLISEISALQFRSIQLNSSEGLLSGLLSSDASAVRVHSAIVRGETLYPAGLSPESEPKQSLSEMDLNKELSRTVLRLSAALVELLAYAEITIKGAEKVFGVTPVLGPIFDESSVDPIEILREQMRSISLQLRGKINRELQLMLPISLKSALDSDGNPLTTIWDALEGAKATDLSAHLKSDEFNIDLAAYAGFPTATGFEAATYQNFRLLRLGVGIVDRESRLTPEERIKEGKPQSTWNFDFGFKYDRDWPVQPCALRGVPGIAELHQPTWVQNASIRNIDPRMSLEMKVWKDNTQKNVLQDALEDVHDIIVYLQIAYSRDS